LSYIHYDESRDFSVIHRNIDSGSVYLNDDWEPKLGDFIHSMKIKASERHQSFNIDKVWISTTDGYTDPTYIEKKIANHKSDMYSFGIVMFELLCGRRAVNMVDQDNKYLAPLAITHYREKKLNEIIDWDLWNQMDSQSFDIFAEIAYDCLKEERSQRPNIDEIVPKLEKALKHARENKPLKNRASCLRPFLREGAPVVIFLYIFFLVSRAQLPRRESRLQPVGMDLPNRVGTVEKRKPIKLELRSINKVYCNVKEYTVTQSKCHKNLVSTLSNLKHKNLVSLVGFCDENDDKIIIIRNETARGMLVEYLSDSMILTWVRRLEICVGVAHALSYIHYDEQRDFSIILRSIDSSRVLLNDEWVPKLSDFTFSMKIKASQRHHSFHTNRLAYVNGYADPAYLETKRVNHKSDMYSFGIVLFELLCGRKSIIDDKDDNHLAPLAITHYHEKKLENMIDHDLLKQMDLHSFNLLAEIAYECLAEERSRRPNIDDIPPRLERALELARVNSRVRPLIISFIALP
ncbi:kinase-like domain, phloem protein 2-like protein, partial [Tanacetum coccineum]